MKKVEAILRNEKVDQVKNALAQIGIVGLNVVNITGRGRQRGLSYTGRGGVSYAVDMLPKTRLEAVVHDADVERVIQTIVQTASTGKIGDGKIFISPVEEVVRVRTGERGENAL
ncbi:MAG: P-II family nitrogen regulator [Desulfobaccales bacterium]